MSIKSRSLILETLAAVSLETQQMEVEEQREAESGDVYIDGVEVSESDAEDIIAAGALSAGITMEAEIKELRNGMKVKFSHGHGKIAKIFTAPFVLNKKHHKASKETPLFLVKHDKGGKSSLHKASALKPTK